MMKMRALKTVLLAAVFMVPVGCSVRTRDSMFPATVADARRFHEITRKQIKDHDTNITEQHKIMDPAAAAAIDKLKSEFDAKMIELDKDAKNIHSSLGENLAKIIAAGKALYGLNGQSVMGVVESLVGEEKDSRVAGVRVAMEDISAVELTTAKVEALLATLSDDTKEKFASVKKDTFDKLTGLKDNEAAFRAALKSELALSDDQMKQLDGMTTEQILAMIAAAVAAAGAGGVAGKTGKSRSHAEIEKLKDLISDITTAAARELPPTSKP